MYRFSNLSIGGSKKGAIASVSCIGHLTRRFGKVNPQGRVIGWPIRSIAVGWEESSPMIDARRVYYNVNVLGLKKNCEWSCKSGLGKRLGKNIRRALMPF